MEINPVPQAYEYSSAMGTGTAETSSNHSEQTGESKNSESTSESSDTGQTVDVKA